MYQRLRTRSPCVAISLDTRVGLNVATRVCDICPDKCWFVCCVGSGSNVAVTLPVGKPFWAPWTKVKCLVLRATKPRLFDRPSRSLVTIRTELFRPLKVPISIIYVYQMYGIVVFWKYIFLLHVLKKTMPKFYPCLNHCTFQTICVLPISMFHSAFFQFNNW